MKKRVLIGLGLIIIICLILFVLGALCLQVELGVISVIAGITLGNWSYDLYDLTDYICKKLDKTKEQEE